ncbi:hypothetical protein PG996_003409 [Apiospora saccharicola]|uniref:Protein kinase domain-containing protein n=1 Tax=Apiospora saccharicola TaxID=335842 RepID=A0ABR1W505_9PEZI
MNAFFRGTASQEQLAALQSYFGGADHVRCRFQYIGLLGAGAFGVAVRIRETFFDGRPSRDFAIKQANTEAHRRELRWEIERIQRVAGGMHIVQPISVDNSRFYDYDIEEAPKVHPSRWDEQRKAYEREGYLLGPLLVIELLEHGALQDLVNKGKNYDVRHWPNRLLWRFFLCLVRACVAMAYPRRLGNNGQTLEEIPPGNGMPSNFTHTDMHAGNVMLGPPDPTHPEHAISPILKLIDFGVWSAAIEYNLEYNDPEEAGITENIFSVGKLMLDLMAGEPFYFNEFIPYHQLKIAKDRGVGGTRAVATYAAPIMKQPPGERYEGMDPDLRKLVAQCLAVDPANRPALGDLLDRVRQGVARTPADYTSMPWGSAEESDEFILSDGPSQAPPKLSFPTTNPTIKAQFPASRVLTRSPPKRKTKHTLQRETIWNWRCCKCGTIYPMQNLFCFAMNCYHLPCEGCDVIARGFLVPPEPVMSSAVPMDGEKKQEKLLKEAHPSEPPKEDPKANEDKQNEDKGGKAKAKEA